MKIGIIIHSKTGTTLRFGKLIAAGLEGHGHQVKLIQLQTDIPLNFGSVRSAPPFQIVDQPDGQEFDTLVIGGPVWAFSASPVLYKAVKGLKQLNGKKVIPVVTMGSPMPAMGGKQAIKLLGETLAGSGADVLPGIIINRINPKQKMGEAVEKIIGYFEQNI